jgi:hypothetical protein
VGHLGDGRRWRRVLRWLLLVALVGGSALGPVGPVRADDLAVVTARALMSPLLVGLDVLPTSVRAGGRVAATAVVSNLGSAALRRLTVRLRVASGLTVDGSATHRIRELLPRATAATTWALCGRVPGSYLVFAEVAVDGWVVDSPVRLVAVTPGSGHCTGAGPGPRAPD